MGLGKWTSGFLQIPNALCFLIPFHHLYPTLQVPLTLLSGSHALPRQVPTSGHWRYPRIGLLWN